MGEAENELRNVPRRIARERVRELPSGLDLMPYVDALGRPPDRSDETSASSVESLIAGRHGSCITMDASVIIQGPVPLAGILMAENNI